MSIPAGSSYETTINAASLHDLSAGGSFTFVAEGAIPYALDNSTELSGNAISFKSNILTVDVDGAAAAVRRSLSLFCGVTSNYGIYYVLNILLLGLTYDHTVSSEGCEAPQRACSSTIRVLHIPEIVHAHRTQQLQVSCKRSSNGSTVWIIY